jgi:predicted TIM-barrel fold metal-dependent hydrolase
MYDGPIIDIDLHHRWRHENDLIGFLEPEWQAMLDRSRSEVHVEAPSQVFYHITGLNKRSDSFGREGAPPGSDYVTTCEQWLDKYPVERAVLSFDIGDLGGVPNPYLATALCRAANDWSIQTWIEGHNDPRLYTAALIPTQIPADGAAELRRCAEFPCVVEALMISNGLGKPFGHPVYHEIYAAAEECGLPIAMHNGGDVWHGTTQATAGGVPHTRFEFHTLSPQHSMTHLASLIAHGVFEKFPKLKLLLIEAGVAWLPWFMWSLDRQYESLRRENPLVKRLPSEYLRDHVCLSSQPMEISEHRDDLLEVLESLGGVEDMLVFASDYPHWDSDDPAYISRRIPKSWWQKVFHDNAADLLRWPDRPSSAQQVPAPASAAA